jgi:hypothetical protein
MPSVFRSRFEEKALLHFLKRGANSPGELWTAIVRQILTIEHCGGRKKWRNNSR